MKNIVRHPLFLPLLFVLLFILGSLTTFYGFHILIPVITFYGRGLLNFLPTILTMAVPLFSIIVLWIYIHNKNIKSKWKTIYIYGLILTGVMFAAIIFQIIIITFIYGWNGLSTSVTPLFPFDVLVFQILFLILGIICLVYSYKNRNMFLVETTFPKLKKGKAVAFSFMVAFSEYFFGILALIPDVYFDGYFDPNWWMIIPTLMLNLLPLAMMILYSLYKHHFKSDKFYFVSLLSLAVVVFVIGALLLIANIVNSKYIYQSMQPFYQLGLTLNIPFAVILLPIGTIILLIVATIRFLKNNKTYEKETNKQKE